MNGWTVPRILDLAPDPSGRKAGQSLGRASAWLALGCDGRHAWGEIKGSGAAPYRSALSLDGPAFRCTYPSRKVPCKHGLDLFLILAEGAAPSAPPPDWVADWAAKRDAASKPAAGPAPADAKARGRRRQQRDAKVDAGVAELDLWLRDLVRRGLAGVPPVRWTPMMLSREVFLMPKTRPPYAPEFRRQIIELARAGRDPADLAREFEPSAQAIRNWVAQADRQEGRREAKPAAATADTALSAAERDELARLRRENKQLRMERDILSRAAAWFARETGAIPSGSSGS